MRGVQRQLFLPAGYPSPKAVGAIFSRSQVHIRRMLLEGSPVIVAMRPHERPSRRRILLYLLGPLPADPPCAGRGACRWL